MANLRSVMPIAAALLVAASAPAAVDYAADARSIEALVNANYAYLERFPGHKMPMTDKLRAEAARVETEPALIRYSERALALLADHHAITGSSLNDSWAVFPSYGDLWVEPQGKQYLISAVREGSPAARAGVRRGDMLLAVDGRPIGEAVAAFWSDLGALGSEARDGYAARVLASGRRNRPRRLTIARGRAGARTLELPNLYAMPQADRPVTSASSEGRNLVIKFHDSLGYDATISAFDLQMAKARPGQRIVLDLTDTPGGGNTVIARAILGWFVRRPTSYQVHSLPAEERETGIARQWIEQVLPRAGKYHGGPIAVRVGRWTGSMGEGLAIGFAAIGARVEGEPMAGLLGAIYDYPLEKSGKVIKFPTERLYAVDGTPRERFVPRRPGAR